MPPHTKRPRFASFNAPLAVVSHDDRATYAGLYPAEAVSRMLRGYSGLSPFTIRQKRVVLTNVLRQLASRGIDLANVHTDDLALYRAYLAHLVERRASRETLRRFRERHAKDAHSVHQCRQNRLALRRSGSG